MARRRPEHAGVDPDARGAWPERVEGIDAGADDYLAKPFHMAEFLARVRALIRRSAGRANPMLVSGAIKFDTRSGTVTRDGVPVILTTFEQRLLQFLMHRTGQIVGRSEIIEHIYAQDFDRDSNTVEVFVRRLRLKLGSDSIGGPIGEQLNESIVSRGRSQP